MRKIRIGIDVGKRGAIVAFHNDRVMYQSVIPNKDGEVDLEALFNGLYFIKDGEDDIHAVVEDVHAIFGSSAKSTFNFGWNKGMLEGMLCALEIPYTLVTPREWQKEMWKGIPLIKEMDNDGNEKKKTDTKATSLASAMNLFPNEDFRASKRSKLPHDGIVDAFLMAEYCKRRF